MVTLTWVNVVPTAIPVANLLNGLLHIDLTREVPEEKKPRKIEIGGDKAKTIESKAA